MKSLLIKSKDQNKSLNAHECREIFRQALRHGEIVQPEICSKCKRDDLPIKHFHKDYNKPLDVIWICSNCYKDMLKQRPNHFKDKCHSEDSKLSMSISHEGIEIPLKVRKKIAKGIYNPSLSKVFPILLMKEKFDECEIGLLKLYRRYASSKKNRKVFTLTLEEFKVITQQNCYYCGCKPSQVSYKSGGDQAYTYNGIDRIDNKLCYKKDNVVPSCSMCNLMKFTNNKKKFINHCIKIANFNLKRRIKNA